MWLHERGPEPAQPVQVCLESCVRGACSTVALFERGDPAVVSDVVHVLYPAGAGLT